MRPERLSERHTSLAMQLQVHDRVFDLWIQSDADASHNRLPQDCRCDAHKEPLQSALRVNFACDGEHT